MERTKPGIYLARGGCFVCAYDKQLVLFPTLVIDEGQLALCHRCIKRAGRLLDLGNVKAQKTQNELLSHALFQATERVKELTATVHSQAETIGKMTETLPEPVES